MQMPKLSVNPPNSVFQIFIRKEMPKNVRDTPFAHFQILFLLHPVKYTIALRKLRKIIRIFYIFQNFSLLRSPIFPVMPQN